MEPMKPMEPMKAMEPMQPIKAWWPEDLGQPTSTGTQNSARYAYFEESRRLVVEAGGQLKIYDTGTHRINGFGQQQGSAHAMTFEADGGALDLDSLKLVQ